MRLSIRQERAGAALAAMLPVTTAAFALWACGCGAVGLVLIIGTVVAYGLRIAMADDDNESLD